MNFRNLSFLSLCSVASIGLVTTSYAQSNCNWPLFPWLCANASAGFPGSNTSIMLPSVAISGSTNSFPYPYFPATAAPVVILAPVGPWPTSPSTPCPGDPIRNSSLAPSSPGNYRGGSFGFTRNSGLKFHDGIDIKASQGSPVFAAHAGTVTAIRSSFAPGKYARNSYGNFVIIRSVVGGQTVYLKYNHLDAVSSTVGLNQPISQGASLGTLGTTGNAAAAGVVPHVHVQARDANQQKMDPENYLGTKYNKTTGAGTPPC